MTITTKITENKKIANCIVDITVGDKKYKLIYSGNGTKNVLVDTKKSKEYALSDHEILQLAKWAKIIEDHYSSIHKQHTPMDIEWAKDGKTGELFIVQARPETIHAGEDKNVYKEYRLNKRSNVLVNGIAVGARIGAGKVRVLRDAKHIENFEELKKNSDAYVKKTAQEHVQQKNKYDNIISNLKDLGIIKK